MKPPQEKFCFLIQFEGFSLRNVDYGVLKQIIDMLQVRNLALETINSSFLLRRPADALLIVFCCFFFPFRTTTRSAWDTRSWSMRRGSHGPCTKC